MTYSVFDERLPRLSVVVPVFNEKDNLLPLITEITAAFRGGPDYELIYVDDGSDDGSTALLDDLANHHFPRLRVVSHHQRCGQSCALVTGIRLARGEWIATLDGDGQNVPSDIQHLLFELIVARELDPSVVCIAGVRAKRNDSLVRCWSSRIANSLRSALLHDGVSDTGCGIKVFRRDAFLALPLFDHVHRFMPALFQAGGGKVLQLPVAHRPRTAGNSKYGISNRLWVGIVDILGVRWLRKRTFTQSWPQT